MFRKIHRDSADKRPLYVKAYHEILEKIQKGFLKEGDKLPPEPDLAKALGISRPSLRQALLILKEDGFIKNLQGSGNYISSISKVALGLDRVTNVPEMLKEKSNSITTQRENISFETPDVLLKELLQIKGNHLLVVFERTYLDKNENIPLAYSISFIPNQTLPEESNVNSSSDLLEFLHNSLIEITKEAVSQVSATEAGEFIAGCLNKKEGETLLLFEELFLDKNKSPLVVSKNYFPSDVINFKFTRKNF